MKWLKRLVAAAAARQVAQEAAAACDCGCENEDDDEALGPYVNAADWRVAEEWQRQPPAHHNAYGAIPDFSVTDDGESPSGSVSCDDPDYCWSAPTIGSGWD